MSVNPFSPSLICLTSLSMIGPLYGLAHNILILIAFESSKGSDKPAHRSSLARAFASCKHKELM